MRVETSVSCSHLVKEERNDHNAQLECSYYINGEHNTLLSVHFRCLHCSNSRPYYSSFLSFPSEYFNLNLNQNMNTRRLTNIRSTYVITGHSCPIVFSNNIFLYTSVLLDNKTMRSCSIMIIIIVCSICSLIRV